MLFIVFLVTLVTSKQVPSTIPIKEKLEFYSNLEKFNYTVKYYKGKGLGLETKFSKAQDENIICVPQELHIRHSDSYPFTPYTQNLNALDQLASRVLYEKFQSKKDTFAKHYIGSIPEDLPTTVNWAPSTWDLLEKFSIFSNITLGFDHSESYQGIRNALKGLMGINQELLKTEAIEWAIRVVKTRSLRFIAEDKKEILVLTPYIDMVNYWYRPSNFNSNCLYGKEDLICIKSPFALSPGDEVLIDYGPYESSFFFTRYLFTIRNNPYDVIRFHLEDHISKSITPFNLESSKVNKDLLVKLLSRQDSSFSPESDIATFISSGKTQESKMFNSLIEYRKLLIQNSELPGKPGLRESLRISPKNEEEKTVMDFAISSRQTIYNHLKTVDLEISKLLFSSLLKNN
jgi:hypothetical protein